MTELNNTCNNTIKNFNNNAMNYEKHAVMQKIIGERLIERLDLLSINPKVILDLGCGTGLSSAALKIKYPNAIIIGLDLAYDMLNIAHNKKQEISYVLANAHQIPIDSNSIDLIFSNQVLHWLEPHAILFNEINRIMSQEGCLFFSTLGPDTFKELRSAWQNIDDFKHCHDFIDMHNLGDSMLQNGFYQPVLDIEYLTLRYKDIKNLLYGLKNQGIKNQHSKKRPCLTTASIVNKLEAHYLKDADQKLPLTYEIVYGHAWKNNNQQHDNSPNNKATFAIDQIKFHN